MADLSGLGGYHPLSDILSRGNKDIQILQDDIAGAAGFKGILEGREVHWKPDAHSMLQDLAEESGLIFGEKLAGRLKRRQDRQDGNERIKNKAYAYIKQVPDLGPTTRKLRAFLGQLRHLSKNSLNRKRRSGKNNNLDSEDMVEIMELAEKEFPLSPIDALADENSDQDGSNQRDSDRRSLADPTLQYAALAFARDVMNDKEEGPAGLAMAESLQACMDQLMENHGEAIRAGMNVSVTAESYCQQGKGETADLRQFYQEIILSYEDLEKAYQGIAQRLQELSFTDAVDYLISAAGKDLGSANPSVSPVLIQCCLHDIKRLQNLTSIYEGSAGLLSALQQKFEIAGEVKPETLFARTLEFFTQRWTAKNVLGRMYKQLGIEQVPPHLFFLSNFMQMVKMAHIQSFAKKDDREIFINAIQEELDSIIAKEESASIVEPV
jgi:type III secretion protein W